MLELLKTILFSFKNGQWQIDAVIDKYHAVTTLRESITPTNLKQFKEILDYTHKILSLIREGTIRENEEYWFRFLRLMEIFTSRIFSFCYPDKKLLLEYNESFFLIACDVQNVYGYFTLNESAIERSVEYDNFRGYETNKMKVAEFNASKINDIENAILKEFILPCHIKVDRGKIVNNGFLPLKIENSILAQNKEMIFEQSCPIYVIGYELYITNLLASSSTMFINLGTVSSIIRDWKPSQTRRYEESEKAELAEYLRKFYTDVKEEKGESEADILIENKLPIETKVNPNKSEFDRLTGQVSRQKKEFGEVIVVLFRISRNDLFEDWKSQYLRDSSVEIITK